MHFRPDHKTIQPILPLQAIEFPCRIVTGPDSGRVSRYGRSTRRGVNSSFTLWDRFDKKADL
jgi:hypothetical protein